MNPAEHTETFQFLVEQARTRPVNVDKEQVNLPRNDDTVITARIRPILEHEAEKGQTSGVHSRTNNIVELHNLALGLPGGPKLRSSAFFLDRIYGPTESTETLYEDLTAPLVTHALKGGIATLFAYGQTGSGKTHTISALQHLLAHQLCGQRDKDGGYRNVHIAIFELGTTLNAAYDLLADRKPIALLEDSFGETRLVGCSEPRVLKASEFLAHVDNAARLRSTAETVKNAQSSRAHAVTRITITDPVTPAAPDGLLYLVDLAGSEALRDTSTTHSKERMHEARDINTSLSVLQACIRGRALLTPEEGKPGRAPYIPFRQSALTKVLKHVFDPLATRTPKTRVVACLAPAQPDVGSSHNTLRYASLLRVPVPPKREVVYDPLAPRTWNNKHMRDWLSASAVPVDVECVAPWHTGAQVLAMAEGEFDERCCKAEGVARERAVALRMKLWKMHVDSLRGAAAKAEEVVNSSKAQENQGIEWRRRVRAGMVVRKAGKLLMVMSPVDAFGKMHGSGKTNVGGNCYVCATFRSAEYALRDAYVLNVWQQMDVDLVEMEEEVVLEYDEATRLYFIGV
ncbi:P-loop containing nucleoside triphosphate hydrolase protein [Microthyrium microscopicum]|uniref:P-loop containing nucleoside triphosphate hydrolase protein n=1 Tax=Microthyrium microscopicum TaxID=703497 RepID=A0A6A6UTG9_9PEZI|nr:P-loop containing nucleoside triphosphate hydrolase protein [Microthyrium microscopicum]